MRLAFVAILMAGAVGLAGPALAAKGGAPNPPKVPTPAPSSGTCALADILPKATLCSGYYTGNILSNSAQDLLTQNAALTTLGTGIALDSTMFGDLEKISHLGGANVIDFAQMLYGTTTIGIHWGGGAGGGVSALYTFDAGRQGTDKIGIALNPGKSSGATLYSTGIAPVPEPASWAMMIAGFGGIGMVMRRRAARRGPAIA